MNELENNTTPNNQQNISNATTGENYMNNNQNSYQASPIQEKKKESSKVGVLIAILFILLIALIGVIAVKILLGNQNQFKTLISNTFNYLENNIKDYSQTTGTFSLKVNGTSTDNDTNEMLNILSKIDIEGNYGVDLESKLVSLELKTNYDKEKLLNMNIYTQNGSGYIYLEDLYDKYIKTDIENYDDLFNNIDKAHYKTILKSLNNAITDSLKDDYFKTSKETLDGKKVTKTKLLINNENYNTIKQDIINALLNDSDFMKSIAVISEKTEDEIKENMQNNIDTDAEYTNNVTLSLYTEKQNFVKLEVEVENDGKMELSKTNDNTYNYSLNTEETNVSGTIKLVIDNNNTEVSISVTDNENLSYEVKLTNTNYDTKVTIPTISESVDYNDLTDEDMQQIQTKLFANNGLMKIITDISSINTSTTINESDFDYDDSYFDDYDYDYDYEDDYEF